ncbi:MAG: class F sortase [Chloroflexi bacterium]|nr:MAG: class F sortase [Chloroflexota bacterium]
MPRRVLVLSLCLVLSALGNQAVLVVAPPAVQSQSGAIAAPSAADRRDELQPTATRPTDLTPVRLVIPSISLDAKIEARGLDSKRNLDTASDFHDVAWYELGPAPGQPGNALINGHAKRVVGANARVASLFAPSPVASLTLITCTGAWNPMTQSDTQRLLVSATVA